MTNTIGATPEERELIERLRQLARQQADGTDFHEGRRLTAEDAIYWVAADTLESLISDRAKLREALEQIANHTGRHMKPDARHVRLVDVTARDLSAIARAALNTTKGQSNDTE